MDSHDLARGRGDYEAVLVRARELAHFLPNAVFAVPESDHGHDGFQILTEGLSALLNRFHGERAGLAVA